MSNLPQGITIEESPSLTKIEAKNYDGTLLLMQIILMLLPLLAINIYLLIPPSLSLIISIPLLLALAYWIIYNIKDNYVILITDEKLEIKKGMHKRQILSIELSKIHDISINRKYGKVLTSARTGLSSKTPNIDELRIKSYTSDILVTNTLLHSNQVFIKNQILKRMNKELNNK